MLISAVIVNYRTSDDLQLAVSTFVQHAPISDWRLTIVNVAPTEYDSDIAYRWRDNQFNVSVLEDPENIGYAQACNWAALEQPGDVYAFFNADVWFDSNAVEHCAQAIDHHRQWGVIGPRQTDGKGRLVHAGIFGTHQHPRHRAWKAVDHGQYTDIEPAVTVSGSAYFVRRDCWEQLTNCGIYQTFCGQQKLNARGAFLPTRHYYEETWCSYHAWMHGWEVMYYGPALVRHEWHRASPIGVAEQVMPESQRLFRLACDAHNIPHD